MPQFIRVRQIIQLLLHSASQEQSRYAGAQNIADMLDSNGSRTPSTSLFRILLVLHVTLFISAIFLNVWGFRKSYFTSCVSQQPGWDTQRETHRLDGQCTLYHHTHS
jgi:hypothetical protein